MKPTIDTAAPMRTSERYIVLDALRGFALLGIAFANFPEFSLYTFLNTEATAAMPTYGEDCIVRFLQYIFIDGKFYTIFSLLFGIGFAHLMFIWSGDILMLYALLGLLLPLFRHVSDKCLLTWSACLLVLPVVTDTIIEITRLHPSAPVIRWQQYWCDKYGITDANFAYWLRDAQDYATVFEFLIQGALVRVQEFVDGNRYFKVLGLFLLGFYIGRKRIYADLLNRLPLLQTVFRYGTGIGLPLSVLYAWSSMHHHPWGLAVHSVLYLTSVFPLGFAYVAGICLLWIHHPKWKIFSLFAAPGRMALTNYIGQSVIGMFLFYGIGLGWGAGIGLTQTECIVIAVFLFQILFSHLWLSAFRFGPLEWIWRMLTYGKIFPLRQEKSS